MGRRRGSATTCEENDRGQVRRTELGRTITPEYLTEESTGFNRDNYLYFIGIDPSYASTGVVVLGKDSDEPLEAYTVRAGEPNDRFHRRMKFAIDRIKATMVQYPVDSTYVVMEGGAFASSFVTFKLGKLAGALEFFLGESGVDYSLVAPTFVKKVATGKGNSTKAKVMDAVRSRWKYMSASNDINDAYVMAQIARGANAPERKKSHEQPGKRRVCAKS